MPYEILTEPRTKPIRYMIAHDDKIIARGMTKATARNITTALMLAEKRPEEFQVNLSRLKNSGY